MNELFQTAYGAHYRLCRLYKEFWYRNNNEITSQNRTRDVILKFSYIKLLCCRYFAQSAKWIALLSIR